MSSDVLMSQQHRSQINKHRIQMMECIDFEHSMLWDYLISYDVISANQRDSITVSYFSIS